MPRSANKSSKNFSPKAATAANRGRRLNRWGLLGTAFV